MTTTQYRDLTAADGNLLDTDEIRVVDVCEGAGSWECISKTSYSAWVGSPITQWLNPTSRRTYHARRKIEVPVTPRSTWIDSAIQMPADSDYPVVWLWDAGDGMPGIARKPDLGWYCRNSRFLWLPAPRARTQAELDDAAHSEWLARFPNCCPNSTQSWMAALEWERSKGKTS